MTKITKKLKIANTIKKKYPKATVGFYIDNTHYIVEHVGKNV